MPLENLVTPFPLNPADFQHLSRILYIVFLYKLLLSLVSFLFQVQIYEVCYTN